MFINCIATSLSYVYVVELDDLIKELSQHLQPQQTWQERQDSSNESWEQIRPVIFEEEIVKSALHENNVSVFMM